MKSRIYSYYFPDTGPIYWAGSKRQSPPNISSKSLISGEMAFRETPDRHGAFDAVCFVEENLGEFVQWRIILDEMLRLLSPARKTLLIIKLTPMVMQLAEFVSFLERRRDWCFALKGRASESKKNDVIVLECVRSAPSPRLDTLGFGLISDGRRPDNVRRFIESLFHIRGIDQLKWQVALCAPRMLGEQLSSTMANENWDKITFVDEPDEWRDAGWITRKKNLLVEALNTENVVIVHDRYVVPPNFVEQLTAFGADFDLVVPRQMRNGLRFPDWTATEAEWNTGKTYLLPYEADRPAVYVNGGALIAKRQVLRLNGWSDLLFWNESEDVELTRRLNDYGITARMAPDVWLEVTDAREGYELAFERTRDDGSPMPPERTFLPGRSLNLRGRTLQQVEDNGLIAWTSQWRFSKEGLSATQRQAELVLCNITGNSTHIELTCRVQNSTTDMRFLINGVSVQPEFRGGKCILPLQGLPQAAGNQLVVTFDGVGKLVIETIELANSVPKVRYPVAMIQENSPAKSLLGQGWWPLESWGLWSKGTVSSLSLPVPGDGQGDLQLVLKIKAIPNGTHRQKPVGITCNGIAITCLSVMCDGKARVYKARIPSAVAMRAMPMTIELSVLATSSPSDGQDSRDQREIGVGLTMVDLRSLAARRWPI